jgi:hypothetical protein
MASTQMGGSTAEQAKEAAQHATEQAKDAAQQATEQARGRVRAEVDRRSTAAGEQATSMADAIRQASQQLRQQGNEQAAKPLDQAAERVQSAGQWLRDSDGDAILRDAEDFGRRNPLVVAAGGLAVGFALSRLLKASSHERYQSAPARPASAPARPAPPSPPARPGNGGLPATTPRPGGVPVPDLPTAPERAF